MPCRCGRVARAGMIHMKTILTVMMLAFVTIGMTSAIPLASAAEIVTNGSGTTCAEVVIGHNCVMWDGHNCTYSVEDICVYSE